VSRIESHRDLRAWQLAFSFGLSIYRVTESLPTSERFGLVSQLRRGAVSVASNISEGYGRGSTQDYLRFLKVARGALFEIDTQLLFGRELGYLDEVTYLGLHEEWNGVSRVLAGLIRSLEPNA